MNFLTFVAYDAGSKSEVVAEWVNIMAKPPNGFKILSSYVCSSAPFPVPPNTTVKAIISEAESADVLASVTYPLQLAGATINQIPLMEVPVVATAETENQLSQGSPYLKRWYLFPIVA